MKQQELQHRTVGREMKQCIEASEGDGQSGKTDTASQFC